MATEAHETAESPGDAAADALGLPLGHGAHGTSSRDAANVVPSQRKRPATEPAFTDLVVKHPSVQRRRRRFIRRAAAFIVLFDAIASVLNIALGDRVRLISLATDVMPIEIPQASALLGLCTSVMLVGLARGLRRGQRPALITTIVLLAIAAVFRVPVGPPQAAAMPVAAAVTFWMLRDNFHSRVDVRLAWRRIAAVLVAAVAITASAIGAAEVWLLTTRREMLTASDVFGLHWSALPEPVKLLIFLSALGVSAVIGYFVTTPRLQRSRTAADDLRARAFVDSHGNDSLSYFALRDDKQHFTTDGGLVAYRIVAGVCLVSPDPLGPDPKAVWRDFRNFAERNGWPVAVLAASEEWTEVYVSEGLTALYLGDEAIVDVRAFTLEGRENRGLRQAVNRMRRYGYTVEFAASSKLGAETRQALRDVSVESRLGDAERGFAMSLSRIASTRDPDLLLAMCRDPEGQICGFCQFVPTATGWSLDVMRRDRAEHPNGMMDLVVAETIDYARNHGVGRLSLNFAALRSLVEGDDLGLGKVRSAMFRFLGRNMQMDSLYRFNSKFQPTWVPRFLCIDGTEYLLPAMLAVVQAEGLFEVPILGRLLVKPANKR